MSSLSAENRDEGTGSDIGVESLGSLMETGAAAAASAGDLAFALRTVAEAFKAQQNMQEKLCEKITEMPDRARILASVIVPDFDGHPNTSVRQYREWKKDLEAIKYVNKLTDQEFALTLYSSVQSRTKYLLACLELPDVRGANGLELIWKILDDAFEQMEHDRFATAWRAWENAQRLPGQPIADLIGTLKKIKLELKELELAHEDAIRELKQENDKNVTKLRQQYEREVKELQLKYELKMKLLREDLELRRKVEVHEIEERVNEIALITGVEAGASGASFSRGARRRRPSAAGAAPAAAAEVPLL